MKFKDENNWLKTICCYLALNGNKNHLPLCFKKISENEDSIIVELITVYQFRDKYHVYLYNIGDCNKFKNLNRKIPQKFIHKNFNAAYRTCISRSRESIESDLKNNRDTFTFFNYNNYLNMGCGTSKLMMRMFQ